jgi:peptidoglycan/LPS O-acetylase OafA/YrhL
MDKILFALYVLFGLVAGCFIGMGNYTGLSGAILPGLIIGALVAGPCIRNRDWRMAAVLGVCGLVGCLAATTFPDNSPVKRFCREQTNLVIHAGSYNLGTSSQTK